MLTDPVDVTFVLARTGYTDTQNIAQRSPQALRPAVPKLRRRYLQQLPNSRRSKATLSKEECQRWLNNFLHWHSDISKRTPEALGGASGGVTVDRLELERFEQGQMMHLLDRLTS